MWKVNGKIKLKQKLTEGVTQNYQLVGVVLVFRAMFKHASEFHIIKHTIFDGSITEQFIYLKKILLSTTEVVFDKYACCIGLKYEFSVTRNYNFFCFIMVENQNQCWSINTTLHCTAVPIPSPPRYKIIFSGLPIQSLKNSLLMQPHCNSIYAELRLSLNQDNIKMWNSELYTTGQCIVQPKHPLQIE